MSHDSQPCEKPAQNRFTSPIKCLRSALNHEFKICRTRAKLRMQESGLTTIMHVGSEDSSPVWGSGGGSARRLARCNSCDILTKRGDLSRCSG